MSNIDAPDKAATPQVIVLCGSTKFKEAFESEQRRLTLEGAIVISVGLFGHVEGLDIGTDTEPTPVKVMLDDLHKRKIDIADAIHVINVNGYIGSSTRGEIEYAESVGRQVTYAYETFLGDEWVLTNVKPNAYRSGDLVPRVTSKPRNMDDENTLGLVNMGIWALNGIGAEGHGYESLREYLTGGALTEAQADALIDALYLIGLEEHLNA